MPETTIATKLPLTPNIIGERMIVILKRADLPRKYSNLEFDKINTFHFMFEPAGVKRTELAVFIEDGKIRVLHADKWPYGKPMSAAELIQYIAKHTA
jgi:hypothetical protein